MDHRWRVALLALVLAPFVASCAASTPQDEPTPDDLAGLPASTQSGIEGATATVRSFLRAVDDNQVAEICLGFTDQYLDQLDPGGGRCTEALATLTRYTGAGEASTLHDKVVKRRVLDDTTAVVVLEDQLTGGNPLPVRLVWQRERWWIDEIGAGAGVTEACIDEKKKVEQAVDEYLTTNKEYPATVQALVPSHLDQLPVSHVVESDGKVVGRGICA